MYTLHMTWPFRVLVISVAMVWALMPQLACFMPDPTATPAEMECCKEMMNDCSGMNMSHECCRTPAHPEVGIIAKATRVNTPHMAEAVMLNVESSVLWIPSRRLPVQDTHAPPHDVDVSPLVLRI
jgi:hypothetical protein